MGNKPACDQKRTAELSKGTCVQPHLARIFARLCDGASSLSYDRFKSVFGETLAIPLWSHLQCDAQSDEVTEEGFCKNVEQLISGSPETYIRIISSADSLLRACLGAAGVVPTDADADFIQSIVKDMTTNGDNVESIVQWKNAVCPSLCQTLSEHVSDILLGRSKLARKATSDVLTDTQMFILCHCLPTIAYFPQLDSNSDQPINNAQLSNFQWTKLYSSLSQGISMSRFEANSFNYKGATVAIFKLSNGEIFAIALDQEWRHSVKKFGGPNTILFQLHPMFKRIDVNQPSVYCNFKNRSSSFGLTYNRFLSIDGDMSNVFDMEVWGCGGKDTLEEQLKQKLWLKRQAEKNSTVPLPGNWDENPDKTLLEMGGFQFSSERKHDRPDD